MADETTTEKTVDAELLDDLMKVDGDFARKGDKVTLTERAFNRLNDLGSVRKWGQSDRKSGETKSDRATEAAQRKQAAVQQPETQQPPTPADPQPTSGQPQARAAGQGRQNR